MKIFFSLFVSNYLVLCSIFSQSSKIDSLERVLKSSKEDTNKVKTLYSLSDVLQQSSAPKALEYANKGILLAKKIGYKKGIISCLIELGNANFSLGDYKKASAFYEDGLKMAAAIKDSLNIAGFYDNIGIINFHLGTMDTALMLRKKAMEIYSALKQEKRLANGYIWIGNIYLSQSTYQLALENYLKALQIYEKLGDDLNGGFALVNISSVYRQTKQFEKARQYAVDAKSLFIKAGNKYGIGASLYRLSLVYSDQNDNDNSTKYLLEAKKYFVDINDKYFLSLITSQLGDNFRMKGDYNTSLKYFNESLISASELGDKALIAENFGNIGIVYSDQKEYKKALKYMYKCQELLKEIGNKNDLKNSFEQSLKIYAHLNNADSTLKYFTLYQQVSDTIYNDQSTKAMAEMQTKYETAKKQTQIENQIKALARKKRETLYLWEGVLSLFTFLLVITLLFVQTRKQKRTITREKNAVSNLTGILKHETSRQFSGLSKSISKILRSGNPEQQVAKAIVEVKTYQMLYDKLFLSSGFATISLKEAFEKLFQYNCDEYNIARVPEFTIEGGSDIVFGKTDYLFHLINELIANSLLHAFKDTAYPKISITINFENSNYKIVYEDNGCGIPEEKQEIMPGKGFYFINVYSKQNLNASLTTDFRNGSKFTLIFDGK